jgi:adenine-specific DNA-methyltransferase
MQMKPLTAEDPETESADVVAENIEHLKAVFPEAFSEGKVDFDVLKQLLGGAVDDREEKYGLNWHGKRRARQLALTPSSGTLRPCLEGSVDWDTTRNIMIEGDNLEVLKLLQKSYAGKVKLIYIDPPYNTGKDFVYPDNFQDNIKNYLELTGQTDSNGNKISSNTEASGRFHTDWLNMMYPRLKLARSLLLPDGVICISIDDRELANLKRLCDEVFYEENYKGSIVRTTGQTTGQDSGGLGASFDYVLIYSKNPETELSGLPLEDHDLERYQDEDSRGKYALWQLRKTGSNDRRTDRPTMFFAVKDPDGNDVFPIGPTGYESCWRFDPKGYERLVAQDTVVWKKRSKDGAEQWWPYVKTYLEGRTKRPSPLWDDLEGSKKASIDLRALFGGNVFSNPKPVGLIQRLIQILPEPSKDCLVLDFFAGSGTTGHALMQLNSQDGGNRRLICVQLPEPLDEEDSNQREAADFCARMDVPKNIAEITKERLRRAAKKVQQESPMFAGDLGFRVFKLASSNIQAWDPNRDDLPKTLQESIEHLKTDRTEQDILFELLLKLGLDLAVPIEQKTLAGKTVRNIGAGTLLVCLAERIAAAEVEPLALGIVAWHKELAPSGETSIVFRDSAFADDVAKTNLTAILQQHGLGNVRSL